MLLLVRGGGAVNHRISICAVSIYIASLFARELVISDAFQDSYEENLRLSIDHMARPAQRPSHAPLVAWQAPNNITPLPKKQWTFAVFMAADNDLYPFADRNLKQMEQVGSSDKLNIVVHMDLRKPRTNKVTRRFLVQKNALQQIGPDACMDSGDENTFIDFIRFIHTYFPSEHLAIVFWNHGSGDLNPILGKAINPSKLFHFNETKNKIELDRSVEFLEYVNQATLESMHKGVCFDESTGHYLDDAKLVHALNNACIQRGKKIDVVLFDACLMAGVGTASIMQNFAHFMVASEEVELGTGYDYRRVLDRLSREDLSPNLFAQHVVWAYHDAYSRLTDDYTHSALNLDTYQELTTSINALAQHLMRALQSQTSGTVKQFLQKCREKNACTHFDEPSYIDLRHFCRNMRNNLDVIQLNDSSETSTIKKELSELIDILESRLNTMVIANKTGKNLKDAGGISIYFPEKRIHASFPHTEFGKNSSWLPLLHAYLGSRIGLVDDIYE